MTAEAMWSAYTAKHSVEGTYEAWKFCGGGPFADLLARLTMDGVKTATSSSLIEYQTEGEALPKPGDYSVILYDNGEAACIIRTNRVSVVPFDEVSARHAWLEGEDDRSLTTWREVHRRAFTPDYERVGKPFDEHGLCVLEEYELAYRPEDAQ